MVTPTNLFTPLEIMPRCSALYTMRCRALQSRYSGITFQIIPAGVNASLEFLTGFTTYGRLMMGNGLLNLREKVKGIKSG
jgi:hypothetical protein